MVRVHAPYLEYREWFMAHVLIIESKGQMGYSPLIASEEVPGREEKFCDKFDLRLNFVRNH